jgi:DNA-binding response OmpR family regulator
MEKHVVVIEDDPELLDFIALSLTEAGYRITTFRQLNSVEELIELKADAFVIDEKLPVTSGHIICIMLKSMPETRQVQVFLISADHRLKHLASLCEADGYLLKPFINYQDLQQLLDQVLVA